MMGTYTLPVVLSLVYLLQIPQGQCSQSYNHSSKSGIVDNYDDTNLVTTQPGKDYSFYDTLDNKGRILFITGTCLLGIILLTMLGFYCKTHSCQMSCGTSDAGPPPLVNVATVSSQLNMGGNLEQPTGQTSRQPSPRSSPAVSRSIFLGPESLSQQDIAAGQVFDTSQYLAPIHSLWRYHSTGRMQTGIPGSPGPGILAPNQALGNVPSRFYASTGHLHPAHTPLYYPSEEQLSQGNLPFPIHQPSGVQVPHSASVPVPHPLPVIKIQSPSPQKNRMRPTMSRWHSEGNLAAGVGAAGQSQKDISNSGGQVWRSPSTGLLCPTYSQPGGAASHQSLLSGGPSTEYPILPGSYVQPSAPPLDIL